jgi:PTS system nitrogen regulatory IIA component
VYLRNILIPDGVLLDLQLASLEHLIDHVSAFAAELSGVRAAVFADALRNGHGLLPAGSTMTPHARVDGLRNTLCFFLRLRAPIMVGEESVDMFFISFLAPQSGGTHLRILAEVARLMRDDDFSQ